VHGDVESREDPDVLEQLTVGPGRGFGWQAGMLSSWILDPKGTINHRTGRLHLSSGGLRRIGRSPTSSNGTGSQLVSLSRYSSLPLRLFADHMAGVYGRDTIWGQMAGLTSLRGGWG